MSIIKIYFHICMINNWQEIVEHLFQAIVDSGLIHQNIQLNYVALGDTQSLSLIPKIKYYNNFKSIQLIEHSTDISIYERLCLNKLHADAIANPSALFLYIHTKSISHKEVNPNVRDWLHYLIYFNIIHYQHCLKMLTIADTCGVDCRSNPYLHYSGNFWWANGSYISKISPAISPDYLGPEMWLLSLAGVKAGNLWSSNVHHYMHPYPKYKYENKQIKPTICQQNAPGCINFIYVSL